MEDQKTKTFQPTTAQDFDEAEIKAKRVDGRRLARKSVDEDKITNIPDAAIGTNQIANNAVTKAKIADDAIGNTKLDYETGILAFASGDTSKTATVTSGSVIIGVYSSSVSSTPAYGELQLSISATTLTGTRSAAPGGAASITYTVILLKS